MPQVSSSRPCELIPKAFPKKRRGIQVAALSATIGCGNIKRFGPQPAYRYKERTVEIDITGRHFRVTEPLKEYIQAKVPKLDKYSLKIESVHVVLEVQKFHHLAEITLLGKSLRLTAKSESADMYAAFDGCFSVLQLQMGRQHDRRKDHKARRYSVKGSKKK